MKQFWLTLRMMLRGVRCNEKIKGNLALELDTAKYNAEVRLNNIAGRDLNVRSPKQMKEFFYDELGCKIIYSRKGKRGPTTDDAALTTIAKRHPVLRPVVEIISDIRSTGVFLSTFVNMSLDADRRIRCSYNVAGTETFRWSSSANAFDSGTNLQNVPEGDSHLPNCRTLFIPDIGNVIGDWDLKGADAQVVAAEAHDEDFLALLQSGLDVHKENAKDIFSTQSPTDHQRFLAKTGVHATNYLAQPRTLAIALGITVREAEDFQRRWFMAHPGIPDWHIRVEDSLSTTRSVSNIFGFRRYYFDRIEGILTEAVAWIPQSTVAIAVNKSLVKIDAELPDVELLLQVHDSGIMQWPERHSSTIIPQIHERMLTKIPYENPLIIPVTCKMSHISWGDCEKIELPEAA
jgi:DNA polymerase I-like protein with 3'-5' exonuclease and polymerase domains